MKKFYHSIQKIMFLSMLLFLLKTDYVNAEESQSAQNATAAVDTRPDYVIYVNSALNCVTVKQQDENGVLTPIRSFICSCGREGHETPEGTKI